MTTRRKFNTMALASAAAALFGAAPITAVQAGKAEVKCFGVNNCKGQNDCKTATNACKGKSSCKGQGFVKMSKHACKKSGGSVNKPK